MSEVTTAPRPKVEVPKAPEGLQGPPRIEQPKSIGQAEQNIVGRITQDGEPDQVLQDIAEERQLVEKGNQLGSNEGGWYTDSKTKERMYVKFYKDTEQGSVEVIANQVYTRLGIPAPHSEIVSVDGKTAVASLEIVGHSPTSLQELSTDDGVREGFVADAFLANWDVTGQHFDNIERGADGKAYRIDNGGSLTFRARGEKKPYSPDNINELQTLLDPQRNPQSAAMFHGITQGDIRTQAQHLVSNLSELDIDDIVNNSGLQKESGEEIRVGMKGRRVFLIKEFGLEDKPPPGEQIRKHIEARQKIREFSKSNKEGVEMRQQTAEQILKARSERNKGIKEVGVLSSAIEETSSNLENLSHGVEQTQQQIAELNEKIETVKAQQAIRSASLVKRVFDTLVPGQKNALAQELADTLTHHSQLQKELEGLVTTQAQLQESLTQNKQKLTEAEEVAKSTADRDALNRFYEDQYKKLQSFEEREKLKQNEKEISEVQNAAEAYGVYFIHGINASIEGGQRNELINPTASWEAKLDILLGYSPAISASTINGGQNSANYNSADAMWANQGVILNGGTIITASAEDSESTAQGLHERTPFGAQIIPLTEQINNAITERRRGVWNELVINNPSIVGFYVCKDWDALGIQDPTRVSDEQIYQATSELGIPLYFVKQGVVYDAEYTSSQIIPRGDPLPPGEVARRNLVLSEQTRNNASERGLKFLQTQAQAA